MFSYVGEKIQKVAKILFWLGSIASIIIGIVLSTDWNEPIWLILAIAGPITFYIETLFLVGFGKLIEHTESIHSLVQSMERDKNGK